MVISTHHQKKQQQHLPALTIPTHMLRQHPPAITTMPELQCVRHFTRLSQKNFSIDTHTYPLGSCTMKYNPKVAHAIATLPGYAHTHPCCDPRDCQGLLRCLHELQQDLAELTGMSDVALTPMAGAQGEFVGIAMIKAFHLTNGDHQRNEMLIPTAAHGTNPASAVQCGYTVIEIPTGADGDIDIDILRNTVGPHTAGIMLTNPSTLGVFERQITEIATIIHQAGGLLYYDGANLNALLGQYRPGDMGFDVMHLNLHKTFATPHGGGGPGAGPVAANHKLKAFLPQPQVIHDNTGYRWSTAQDCPQSIGRTSSFMGNVGVLLRAYCYIRLLGRQGLPRVSQYATLNANYLMHHLRAMGYTIAFNKRRASHEFIITLQPLTKQFEVTALDVAKRLLDYQIHAPTIYFPLLVAECLLIEPTETESRQELDHFLQVMQMIYNEITTTPERVKQAPVTLQIQRADEVRAAKQPILTDPSLLQPSQSHHEE